jgi:glycine oxidase
MIQPPQPLRSPITPQTSPTSQIIIVGCGVVGAAIAYELSLQLPKAKICVLDKQPPAQGSTGAALGVLMGVTSSRLKGRTWKLREASIRRYQSLLPELAAQGHPVPFNADGIVSLSDDPAQVERWQHLRSHRATQGWPLEIWNPSELSDRCPHVQLNGGEQPVIAALYSPADGQIHPTALTNALLAAAQARGVTVQHNAEATGLLISANGQRCLGIKTSLGEFAADQVILSAGLGSMSLANINSSEIEPLALMPVLGQAMEIQLPQALGNPAFQPVVNGHDIHLVPLGEGRYWLGATVEFPDETIYKVQNDPQGHISGGESSKAQVNGQVDEQTIQRRLEAWKGLADGLMTVQQGAEKFVGAIAQAQIIHSWRGLRPRPVGQPAPVLKPLARLDNVMLATGHYRNGVLLAPATAQMVCDWLKAKL